MMKSFVFISLFFLVSIQISAQEKEKSTMYCFASVTDLSEVTLISEIYEISRIEKEASLISFKITNTSLFYKITTSMGYRFPSSNTSKGVVNLITISNDWQEVNALYDDVREESEGKLIVIDKESFSIISPPKKENLIRE